MTAFHKDNESHPSSGEIATPAPGQPRLLRLPELMARVGLKRSTIYQRMAEGKFPRSRSLGPKCAVWVESEIDAWIREVAATGRKAADPEKA